MRRLYVLILFAFLLPAAVQGALINPDFSDELTGWQALGPVSVVNQRAVLGDGSVVPGDGSVVPSDSRLWQAVQLDRGNYTINFRYLERLSMQAAQGTFHDVFFASLYFVNDLKDFDLDRGEFTDSQDLLDLQGSNLPTLRQGQIMRFQMAGEQQFSARFINNYRYVIPVFELFDLNFVGGDSRVELDDIQITRDDEPVVPEPATLGLISMGVGLWSAMRRRRS